jgi:hypothetical protein
MFGRNLPQVSGIFFISVVLFVLKCSLLCALQRDALDELCRAIEYNRV